MTTKQADSGRVETTWAAVLRDENPPLKWLLETLRGMGQEWAHEETWKWASESDPTRHVCWIAADLIEAAAETEDLALIASSLRPAARLPAEGVREIIHASLQEWNTDEFVELDWNKKASAAILKALEREGYTVTRTGATEEDVARVLWVSRYGGLEAVFDRCWQRGPDTGETKAMLDAVTTDARAVLSLDATSTEGEVERLQKLLNYRDEYIVEIGQWQHFADWCAR